ncbi:hypothetical protein [Glycomyces sp. YM15]|uniref:hypothetical protein n=1 Tax=Glycomyces sp. YM15 TaxID=2800446 RepID=UPI001964D449|nr:hypothetical protein [Glycomyces sp. YM15]
MGEVWGEGLSVQLLVLAVAAVAAPLLVDRLERWVRLPSVVVEMVLGIGAYPFGVDTVLCGEGEASLPLFVVDR